MKPGIYVCLGRKRGVGNIYVQFIVLTSAKICSIGRQVGSPVRLLLDSDVIVVRLVIR